MKKQGVLLMMVVLLFSYMAAKDAKVVILPGLLKPNMMFVDSHRVFIAQQTSIYIYSLEDYKLIKKFGKSGEGPREFKLNPFDSGLIIFPYRDQLLINSDMKISYFTRKGEFIKEIKTATKGVFVPIKDNFFGVVTKGRNKKFYLGVQLFNSKFEPIKELYITDFEVGRGATYHMPVAEFFALPYKGHIFALTGGNGFIFDVFDSTGKKLYRIDRAYKPVPVPASYKRETMRWFKKDSPYKQYIGSGLLNVSFKTYYPAIKNFFIDNDKLYVITNKQKSGNHECVILDLKGNELKRVFLPVPPEDVPLFGLDLYTIRDDTFYSLVDNDVKELWELHIHKIK